MGWLERRRQRHAAEQAAAQAAKVAAVHDAWQKQLDEARDELGLAQTYYGEAGAAPEGVLLKPGERLYLHARGALLVEVRHAPGHYVGGSQGVSLHIMKGVNYRVGSLRGHYEPGPESPTPLDEGDVTITDQRVAFTGEKQSREWLFDKLLGYTHSTDAPWTALQVSNRQKVSGFAYDQDNADNVKFRLELALSAHRGTRSDLVQHCQQALQDLQAAEPPIPPSLTPAVG
jgi:hypothetical protein